MLIRKGERVEQDKREEGCQRWLMLGRGRRQGKERKYKNIRERWKMNKEKEMGNKR